MASWPTWRWKLKAEEVQKWCAEPLAACSCLWYLLLGRGKFQIGGIEPPSCVLLLLKQLVRSLGQPEVLLYFHHLNIDSLILCSVKISKSRASLFLGQHCFLSTFPTVESDKVKRAIQYYMICSEVLGKWHKYFTDLSSGITQWNHLWLMLPRDRKNVQCMVIHVFQCAYAHSETHTTYNNLTLLLFALYPWSFSSPERKMNVFYLQNRMR